jgi:hypothetical protein
MDYTGHEISVLASQCRTLSMVRILTLVACGATLWATYPWMYGIVAVAGGLSIVALISLRHQSQPAEVCGVSTPVWTALLYFMSVPTVGFEVICLVTCAFTAFQASGSGRYFAAASVATLALALAVELLFFLRVRELRSHFLFVEEFSNEDAHSIGSIRITRRRSEGQPTSTAQASGQDHETVVRAVGFLPRPTSTSGDLSDSVSEREGREREMWPPALVVGVPIGRRENPEALSSEEHSRNPLAATASAFAVAADGQPPKEERRGVPRLHTITIGYTDSQQRVEAFVPPLTPYGDTTHSAAQTPPARDHAVTSLSSDDVHAVPLAH